MGYGVWGMGFGVSGMGERVPEPAEGPAIVILSQSRRDAVLKTTLCFSGYDYSSCPESGR